MIETYKKIFDLLTRFERRRFAALLAMVLLMGITEAAGVASILPFLAVLSDPSAIETNALLFRLYEGLGFSEINNFLIALGSLIFCLVLFSLIFKAFTLYALVRFSHMRNFSISRRLLAHYLGQPYAWFLNQHSADLGKTVLSEVDQVVDTAIIPAMRSLAHVAVVIFLIGLIIAVDPLAALGASITVGGSYLIIYTAARRYLARIGHDRLNANRERYQIAQEAFGGIKELKVRGIEGLYQQRFHNPARRFARRQAANRIIADTPRYILEAVAFGGMLALVLVLLIRGGGNLAAVIPIIGLYAFAGARLLPAMQQLYSSLTMLRFGRPALDALHRTLTELPEQPPATVDPLNDLTPPLRLQRRLVLKDVTYRYPRQQRPALNKLNLTIEANTTVGFVGGSGAGKTTAVDVILGLLSPASGSLQVDGTTVNSTTLPRWRPSLGYVPQEIFLTDDTIAANIAFGVPRESIDQQRVENAARLANLHDFVMTRLPEQYDTAVGERGVRLSGGQRQRIGIARALYWDPDVLILDEATSALDNLTEKAVMEAVQSLTKQKTIILIAHRLTTVRDCHRIFLFREGAIEAEGTYEQLIRDNATFRALANETSAVASAD